MSVSLLLLSLSILSSKGLKGVRLQHGSGHACLTKIFFCCYHCGTRVVFLPPCLQGNRQGLDMGTEYRSIILCEDKEQLDIAVASKEAKQVIASHTATARRVVSKITHPEGKLEPRRFPVVSGPVQVQVLVLGIQPTNTFPFGLVLLRERHNRKLWDSAVFVLAEGCCRCSTDAEVELRSLTCAAVADVTGAAAPTILLFQFPFNPGRRRSTLKRFWVESSVPSRARRKGKTS